MELKGKGIAGEVGGGREQRQEKGRHNPRRNMRGLLERRKRCLLSGDGWEMSGVQGFGGLMPKAPISSGYWIGHLESGIW